MTFWDLVCEASRKWPDWVFLADDYGRTMTTAQFRDTAERVAAALPVATGDVVSWQLPTTLEAAVLMAALSRLDTVQNPLVPTLRHHEIDLITDQVGTSLFVLPDNVPRFRAKVFHNNSSRVLTLNFGGTPTGVIRLPMGDPLTLKAAPDVDRRWVYYSSGTTAHPKGVKHSDSSLMASANGLVEIAGFGRGDVYPIAWPLAHIGGATMLSCALRTGLKLVLFDTWDPKLTPLRMAAHSPTILGSALPFFRAYTQAQQCHGKHPLFPQLRTFTAGGAPTPAETVQDLVETFGVSGVPQSYGLTEFPVAAAAPYATPGVHLDSVGIPAPGAKIRIVDGEIRLRGSQCFSGYVDTSLDADAFDAEGWLRTGDIGEFRDGLLYVTGRLKDVIIRNAETISALDIEDVLLRHPQIIDAAVIGLPDPATGERMCAVLQAREGAELDVAGVAAHCQAHGLAKHKWPEQVEIVSILERDAMGKLAKRKLLQHVLSLATEREFPR